METTTRRSALRDAKASLRHGVARVADLLAAPLLPEDYLELLNPLHGSGSPRGQVLAVFPETRDAATLTIRASRGWPSHIPGQYVRVGVDVNGVRHWRAYSITSPPKRDRTFSITVKAIPDGVVSTHLVHRVKAGTSVHLAPPTGEFTMATSSARKILFVTAGSGITPVMGIVRSALAAASASPTNEDRSAASAPLPEIVWVHSAPTAGEVIFGGELRRLANLGLLRLLERHTDVEGMLTTADLERLVPDLAERETWACGPAGLLTALEEYFATVGLQDRLHTERFRPSVAAVGEGGEVTFERSGAAVTIDGATPLLSGGESAGVLMPAGCRMGICFGCVVPLLDGAVRDLRSGEITQATPGDTMLIQTCINSAAGACTLDL
jgi:ferredoxin-NADP reductase